MSCFTAREIEERKAKGNEFFINQDKLNSVTYSVMNEIIDEHIKKFPNFIDPRNSKDPFFETSEYQQVLGNRLELISKMLLLVMTFEEIKAYFPRPLPSNKKELAEFQEKRIPELEGVNFTQDELYDRDHYKPSTNKNTPVNTNKTHTPTIADKEKGKKFLIAGIIFLILLPPIGVLLLGYWAYKKFYKKEF